MVWKIRGSHRKVILSNLMHILQILNVAMGNVSSQYSQSYSHKCCTAHVTMIYHFKNNDIYTHCCCYV